MPWETLGLEAETATERDVKRAYAKLLKENRPGVNPEGFRKVNEAYEQAKMQLQWRDRMAEFERAEAEQGGSEEEQGGEEGGRGPVEPDPEGFFPESKPIAIPEEMGLELDPFRGRAVAELDLPPVFEERKQQLREALDSEDEGEIWGALAAYNGVCIDHPECIGPWGESFESEFAAHRDAIVRHLPTRDLLRELEFERDDACHFAITGYQEKCDFKGPERLALEMLNQPGSYRSEAAARVAARLATLLAMARPKLIEGLANHAYENLPVAARNWMMNQVEFAISRARLFNQHLTAEEKEFWSWRLLDPERDWDWNTAESVERVAGIGRTSRFQWHGLELIREILPKDVWKTVELAQKSRKMEFPAEAKRKGEPRVSGGSSVSWGLVLLMVYFLIRALISADGCSSRSSPSQKPTSQSVREQLKKSEELLESIRKGQQDLPSPIPNNGNRPEIPKPPGSTFSNRPSNPRPSLPSRPQPTTPNRPNFPSVPTPGTPRPFP